MKKLLLTLLIVSTNAIASEEVDALCGLYKAKAELTSSLLASPYLYGSSNESNTATVALAYSLSGKAKGDLAKEIAQAKCDSTVYVTALDQQQRWLLVSITKGSVKTEITALYKARELAKEQLAHVEKQLASNTATITEYNSSRQVLLGIESRINSIRSVLAEPSLPITSSDTVDTLNKARIAEGTIAELTAKQEAASAWDVSLAAGAQKDLNDSSSGVGPFIGIGFRWSFGNYGAKDSVAEIKKRTEAAFSLSQSGYAKTSERLMSKVSELLVVEQDREKLLQEIINDSTRIINSLEGINTDAALSTKRNMLIQQLVFTAELNGVQYRINKYSGIKN